LLIPLKDWDPPKQNIIKHGKVYTKKKPWGRKLLPSRKIRRIKTDEGHKVIKQKESREKG